MEPVNLMLLAFGAIVLVSALFKTVLRKFLVTGPMIAISVGALVGPFGLGYIKPSAWPVAPLVAMEQLARVTVALVLMHIAIHLPHDYLRKHWRRVGILVAGAMLMSWGISTLCGLASLGAFGQLGLLGILLTAAAVTPTDPVLAGTVVTGQIARENIPARLRNLLFTESAANDGLTYLFVMLPILLLTLPTPGAAWTELLTKILIWEVLGAIALGLLIGLIVGKVQVIDEKKGWSGHDDQTITTLALTLAVLGLMKLLGTNGILAAFCTGVGLKYVAHGRLEREEATIQNVVVQLVQLPAFVVVGLILPWDRWVAWGWAGIAFVLLILALRRLPALLILCPLLKRSGGLAPGRLGWGEAAFAGWFGPIGVASVFYATLIHQRLGVYYVWELVSLSVFTSVFLHGISAYPLARLLGRYEPKDATQGSG